MKLIKSYQDAALASGRSAIALFIEALRLRIAPNQLGLTEYIDYQLYKQDLPWEMKLTFGGQRTQSAAEELLVDDYSKFLSLDKVTMYALLSGHGLPIPTIRATYRSIRPSLYTQLQSIDELARFLQTPNNLPVYIKRSFGAFGRDNVLIKAVEDGKVIFGNDTSEPLDSFSKSLDEGRSLGWILQQPLTPHSQIAELTGSNKISGLRVHTFLGKNEPRILKVVFKLNAGDRDSDNFQHGASGNMLAAVNVESGRILRAISGVGLQQVDIPIHPKTKATIVDFQIPHWEKVTTLVLDAQKAFPGFLCPGWDIALCEDGPRILEVNAFGDIDLPQHAYRNSFFDYRFISSLRDRDLLVLLTQRGNKNKYSPKNHRLGVKKHHWMW